MYLVIGPDPAHGPVKRVGKRPAGATPPETVDPAEAEGDAAMRQAMRSILRPLPRGA